MRPAFGRGCGPRCGDDPKMTKALDAPWVRLDLKSPWCASAMYLTLILVIRYFYRFRGSSMSSQSVDTRPPESPI
jgi:hypothetical protein